MKKELELFALAAVFGVIGLALLSPIFWPSVYMECPYWFGCWPF